MAEDFERVLMLLADVTRRPSFPESEIETRRGHIQTLIRQEEDSPAAVATETLVSLLYGDTHPYGKPVLGRVDTVARIDRAALVAFHAAHVTPAGTCVVVVGDVEPSRASAAIEHVLGDWTGAGDRPSVTVPPVAWPTVRQTRVVPMIEAGHPVPDAAGLESAARALKLAEGATKDDLVLVLMSGGASANWIAPAGITFAEKQAVTRALLRSGANIGEMNTVRKHLSRIKGGRLARAAFPAQVVTRNTGRRGGDRARGDPQRDEQRREDDARNAVACDPRGARRVLAGDGNRRLHRTIAT